METLAQELAKALNVTVDKAIELLPVVRQQFIIHSTIGVVLELLWWIFGVSMAIGIGVFTGYCTYTSIRMTEKERQEKNVMVKVLTVVMGLLSVSSILIAVAKVMQISMAPDYSILLKFLVE